MPKIRASDGAEIFYETRGAGPIHLAFAHGWGGIGGLWLQTARHLDEKKFCSWLIDLRGHGRSTLASAGYELDDFASDILAVADQAGAECFIPVGFSLGGKLTLYLTAKYRSRVPAQILVAPVGPGPSPLSHEIRQELIRGASDWKRLKTLIGSWFGPGMNDSVIDACCRAVSRTPASVLEVTSEKLLAASLPQPFGRTDAPTLVIIGECDPHYGPEYQRQGVLPYLSCAETATLPSGHFVPLEHPVELAALISDFASKHPTHSSAHLFT